MSEQYLFPVNNAGDSLNTWLNSDSTTGSAYSRINEGVVGATDSDYVIYQTGASSSPKITLGRLLVVPSSIVFKYRASGDAIINSILFRDTNNISIASTSSPISISGGFSNREVSLTLSGSDTRNYGNVNIQFNFSGVPSGVAFSAMDMRVSGDYNAITSSVSLYTFKDPVKRVRFPGQSGDNAWTNGFNSGFGPPEEEFPFYIYGKGTPYNSVDLFTQQSNIIVIRPSGDAGFSGLWVNSSGGTTDMWDYVNDRVDNSITDSDYIYNVQSGVTNKPDALFWIADSGIFKSDLDGSNIERIESSNSTLLNATHGCYDPINDFIYYGYEIGTQKRIGYHIVGPEYDESNIINNYCGGMCFDPKTNNLFVLSKEGYFHKINSSNSASPLTFLAGNFREVYDRRLRIDTKNRHIYAVAQDKTSTLSRLYRYNIDTSGWSQLRTLSHGLFGGSFDIDVANSSIYYNASPSDLISPSYYGIIKENMYSGVGTRIVEPSGSAFFQSQELIVDTNNSKLYYIAQDNSGSTLNYRTVKTNLDGTSPITIHTIPEGSGANVLLLNGPIYKSYIDFHLTDFDDQFGDPNNSNKTIAQAYVSAEIDNLKDYSYLTAKILTKDKTEYIWYPVLRNENISYQTDPISIIRIGKNISQITSELNSHVNWDDAILRLELSSINSDNSGEFTVYNTEVSLIVNANELQLLACPLYMFGQDTVDNNVPLWTMAGVSNGGKTLYTCAAEDISGITPLFINGLDIENSSINLYTNSMSKEISNVILYISGLTPSEINSTSVLYTIGGSPNAVGHTKLYMAVDGATNRPYGKMNLFIDSDGTESAIGRMNMFLHSEPIKIGSNTTLYLENNMSGVNNFATLYLETRDSLPSSGNMPLFIQRDTESLGHNTSLYIQVNNGENSGIYLYTYSMPKSTNNMTLVIPEVLGVSDNTRTFYINGF